MQRSVKRHGYCVIVASEGTQYADGAFLSESGLKDAFGHSQLGGLAPQLRWYLDPLENARLTTGKEPEFALKHGFGGVKAALDQSAAIQTEAMFISRWMSMLDEARLHVLAAHQMAPAAEKLKMLELEGIKNSIKNLRTFPFLSELESNGRLALHGAYFDIATGQLSALNETTGQFYKL